MYLAFLSEAAVSQIPIRSETIQREFEHAKINKYESIVQSIVSNVMKFIKRTMNLKILLESPFPGITLHRLPVILSQGSLFLERVIRNG